jgi:hypothetical protein
MRIRPEDFSPVPEKDERGFVQADDGAMASRRACFFNDFMVNSRGLTSSHERQLLDVSRPYA